MLAAAVPQGERELPAQVLEHPLLILLPQMRDDLRVAVRDKAVAESFEPGTHVGVIEEFPVEDDRDGTVFIADGLLAVRETNDAEAPRRQRQRRQFQEALLVRTAMHDGVRHGADRALRNRPAPLQIDKSRNPAHARSSSPGRHR